MLRARSPRRRRAPRSCAPPGRPAPGPAPRAPSARPPRSSSERASAPDAGCGGLEPRPRRLHALPHDRRGLLPAPVQLGGARPRHRHHQVEAVEQRARELLAEARQPCGRAGAAGRVALAAAGAEVHRRDQLEAGREDRAAVGAGDADDAVLERLAQRLQHRALELGELVQQQHAAMRQARLARAAGRCRRRRSRPSRRSGAGRGRAATTTERVLARKQPDHRVDTRHLERLLVAERRQDPRQPAREHRLARAGRTGQEQVVAPGGGDLERPAPRRCPFTSARSGHEVRRADRYRGAATGSGSHSPRMYATASARWRTGTGSTPGQRHLGGRLGGAEHELDPGPSRPLGHDQRSPDRPHPAVERQLADGGVRPERARRNLVRGGEDGERDRQVEAGALLAQVGRRQVDGDAPERPLQLGRDDAAANALLRLLAGAVGQPDDGEGRHPLLQVRLDFDPPRLQPDERVGQHLREHTFRLRAKPSRVCHGTRCRNSPGRASRGRARVWTGTIPTRTDGWSESSSWERVSAVSSSRPMLSEALGEDVDVTLIDKNDAFVFGYSKLDVMFGRTTPEAVRLPYRDIAKPGVRFLQETITAIDPEARRVDHRRRRPRGRLPGRGARRRLRPGRHARARRRRQRVLLRRRRRAARRGCCPAFSRGPRDRRRLRGAVQVPAGAERVRAAPARLPVGAGRPRRLRDLARDPVRRRRCRCRPTRPSALVAAFAEREIEFVPGRRVELARPGAPRRRARRRQRAALRPLPRRAEAPRPRRRRGERDDARTATSRSTPQTLETRFPGVYAVGDVAPSGCRRRACSPRARRASSPSR